MGKHYSALLETHLTDFGPGGAMWRGVHGVVADLPQGILLRLADDAADTVLIKCGLRTEETLQSFLRQIGEIIGPRIRENDLAFFRTLVRILKARSEGPKGKEWLAVLKLTRKELGISARSGRGRKPKPNDLLFAEPRALIELMALRCSEYVNDRTDAPISRKELKDAIEKERGAAIAEFELSRLIKRANIAKFMESR